MGTETKTCRICKASKPLDSFYFRPDSKTYRTECKSCYVASKAKQRPKTKEQNRRYLIESYGITLADYENLRLAQNYKCAICGLPEESNMHGKLFIDHSHTTNKVRGLLCSDCNTALGKFRDNPVLMLRAAEYVNCP